MLYILTINLLGQTNRTIRKNDLNTKVYGYVISESGEYISTAKGLLLINNTKDSTDKWQKYYREVYGDSTIINPNTVIGEQKQQMPIQFLVPVDITKRTNQSFSFSKQLYLYDFMQVDSIGNYNYKPGIMSIIGSLEKNKEVELPKAK